MVLADTNVWCNFFGLGEPVLSQLLEYRFLSIHPLVIGELSMGNLPNRKQTLSDLGDLPTVRSASYRETSTLLEENRLWGRGLQWNDLMILASVLINPDTLLWTHDRRLAETAATMSVSYEPS